MENNMQLAKSNPSLDGSGLSKRETAILKQVVHLNMLMPFKMDYDELSAWTKELNRLLSASEMKKIPFLIDCFKKEEILWDRTVGIQNIFRGLKQIYLEGDEYKVHKKIY